MADSTTFWILFSFLMTSLRVACAQSNATYEWRAEAWSGCVYRDTRTCCDCYRKRDVHCALKHSEQRIAPFYCRKLLEPQPPLREKCEACQQDCVFSAWGGWSACSETCTPSTRFRSRDVLLLQVKKVAWRFTRASWLRTDSKASPCISNTTSFPYH